MTRTVQHSAHPRNPDAHVEEWQAACAELCAALEECERQRCGISPDAARMVDLIVSDESFGPVAVRHAARTIRRETPTLARRAAEVRAWRALRREGGGI